MTLRLVDLEAPPEDVELPNGRIFSVRPLDGPGYALAKDASTGTEATLKFFQYVLIPKDGEEPFGLADLSTLSPGMVVGLLAHSKRQLDLVLDALKNGHALAVTTASTGQRSTPKMTTPRRPRASRARSAGTGSSSGESPSTKLSPPSTS